jgi:adenosine deaminase
MSHLKERDITIEMCPVSNLRTGVVNKFEDHPIRAFIDKGIRVTVNSDDPSMFGTDMNNEYIQLHRKLGFTVSELFQISLNAVDSSFLPEARKVQLREDFIDSYRSLIG